MLESKPLNFKTLPFFTSPMVSCLNSIVKEGKSLNTGENSAFKKLLGKRFRNEPLQ
jgi:hypothetical protein